MPSDLDRFLGEVRDESKAAGPTAVAEFEAYLRHFDLSGQILALRNARGWSQVKLARQSGVQQSEISRIESGHGNPTYQTLSALAAAMNARLTFVPVSARALGAKRKAAATRVKSAKTATKVKDPTSQ